MKRIVVCLFLVLAVAALGACSRDPHVTSSLTGPGQPAEPFRAVKPPPTVGFKSFSITPTSVAGGASAAGSLRLSSTAPTGGTVVTLASSDAAAQVPASITIPAGQATGSFTVTTVAVATNHTATITATAGTSTASVTMTVNAPTITSVALAPASITAGAGSTGTVTLSAAAAAGGAVIALSSSLPASASVPATVTVPAGASTATFAVSTVPAVSASSAIITGSLNGLSRTATLAIAASDPCVSVNKLGGAVVIATQDVKQFRTGRLRVDLTGDVPLAWINAMGTCATSAAPPVAFVSGTGNMTLAGTATSVTGTGAPLAFGPLAVPIPAEAGTVLATDAAGNTLQIIWPALAGLPAGPPVLRLQLTSWNPAVISGTSLDCDLTFTARTADGATATFTAHGAGMPVPTFIP